MTPKTPVNEEAGFHAAMRADPEDDTSRLVYADYLQDHGNDAAAHRIRWWVKARRAESVPGHPGRGLPPWVHGLWSTHHIAKAILAHDPTDAALRDRTRAALLDALHQNELHHYGLAVRPNQEIPGYHPLSWATRLATRGEHHLASVARLHDVAPGLADQAVAHLNAIRQFSESPHKLARIDPPGGPLGPQSVLVKVPVPQPAEGTPKPKPQQTAPAPTAASPTFFLPG